MASYVIHEPPSGLISDTILIPVALTLSRPITGIERLPARSKLSRLPPYFDLDNFLRFDSRVTFRHLPRCCRPDSQPCRRSFSRNNPALFYRKYDGDPGERMTSWSWWFEAEKWRHQRKGSTSSKGQPRPRRLVRFLATSTSPPTLLLKSRDESSCSGGELWRPSNHATVISRWWCHVTFVTVVNHGLIQNCLEILIQIYDRGWLTIAINFSNKSFQKLKLKCSGVAKYCIGNYGGVNTFYKRSKLLKWIKTEKEK